MKVTIKAKSALASLLHWVGINSWKLGRYSRRDIAILMYHRIIPAAEMEPFIQAGMVVEPGTLELHIQYLREFFDIIPFSDLVLCPELCARESGTKPLCVLTFDDGWRDFYQYAFPVLKSQEAPATVFLPTDFIGTERWFWTDRLGFLLEHTAQQKGCFGSTSRLLEPLLAQIVKKSGPYTKRLESAISLLKPYRIEKIEEVLREFADILSEDPNPQVRAFLSWEEVQEMSGSGLISFGSHTAGHPILTMLSDVEAEYELRESMKALISHKVVDARFMPFCYPNGNFSTRLSEMVNEVGYHLAVTTQYGWNQFGANIYTLRRIAIHQDITATEAMLAARLVNA